MSRTVRKGWKATTGSDSDNRGIKHHATNDWFSKKNACQIDNGYDDTYWGRDKRGVKQASRRRVRRALNKIEFIRD